jgi:3D (Asp-Asp-Asp) domain-containing protein
MVNPPLPDGGIPVTEMTATFQLPSGTVSFANGQQFTTACIANLSYKQVGNLPSSTHGTSTFDCVGYNNGTKSLGCSVQWSGPTNVTANVTPGGQAVAAFTCVIIKLETIQFISSYNYNDAIYQTLNYSAQDLSSSIKTTN